jgi:tetratricopeptide (TPR) repeat protein
MSWKSVFGSVSITGLRRPARQMACAVLGGAVVSLATMAFTPVYAQGLLQNNRLLGQTASPELEEMKNNAQEAYQAGDYPEVVELTSAVLAQNPQDHVALYLRASARVEMGISGRDLNTLRAGIEDSRNALRFGGNQVVNYYLPYFYGMTGLAQLEGRKEHAEVVVQFADSVLARPTLTPDDRANLLFQRANARVYLKDYEAAIRDFTAAIAAVPAHLGAHLGLADCQLRAGNVDLAQAAFTAAVQSNADNPLVYNNRGMFFQQQGRHQEAITDFTQAIKLNPNFVVAVTNRGYAALQMGDGAAAENDLNLAMQMAPNVPLNYSLRGTARMALGRIPEAMQDYNQALKLDPRNPMAYADLGFAQYFTKQYPQALSAFDQAVKLDPNLRFLDPWRYMTMLQVGQGDGAPAKFKDSLTKAFVDRDWTDKVLQYLSDAMPQEQLLTSVEKTNRMQQAAQTCEAWYFIAEKKKLAGDQAGATAAYQNAIASGATQLSAYRGAQMALRAN